MSQPAIFAIDLVAILVLTFGLYFPRHRRRDLVVAYVAVNIGVLAVAQALSSGAVGIGLGLGLFGVLSIIRLRSDELDQPEIAYYFSALALGLLGGVEITTDWLAPSLMVGILVAMFVADHPRLLRGYRRNNMTLDQAFTDESALVAHLQDLLGARVHHVAIRRVDMVQQTTTVEVRYQLGLG